VNRAGGAAQASPGSGLRIGRRPRQHQQPLYLRISERHSPNNNLRHSDQQEDIEWGKPSLLERIRSATPPLLSRIQPFSPEQSLFTNYNSEYEKENTTNHIEDPDYFQEQAEEFLREQLQQERLEVSQHSSNPVSTASSPHRYADTYNNNRTQSPKSSSSVHRWPFKPPQIQNRSDQPAKRLDNEAIEPNTNNNVNDCALEETSVVTVPYPPQTVSASESTTSVRPFILPNYIPSYLML
jgi:hypothetical protein